jgi:hypothetical protein
MAAAAWRVKASCGSGAIRPRSLAMSKAVEREKRLAEALRENLRRRKAQAREMPAGTGGDGATEGGEAEWVDGVSASPKSSLHQPPAGPPPRPGKDL